jgi:hypothetical protein
LRDMRDSSSRRVGKPNRFFCETLFRRNRHLVARVIVRRSSTVPNVLASSSGTSRKYEDDLAMAAWRNGTFQDSALGRASCS